MNTLLKSAAPILGAMLVLSGCSSGSSGGSAPPPSPPPPPPPPPPPVTFEIGGTVSGLEGSGLVLQNNSDDDLTVTANGAFTFGSELDNGTAYLVTVLTQPTSPAQVCTVQNGEATVAGEVTDVLIDCNTVPVLSATSDIMQLHLVWAGTDSVDVLYSSDADCDWSNVMTCEAAGVLANASGGALTLGAMDDGLDPDVGWFFVVESAAGLRSNRVGARPLPPAFNNNVLASAVGADRLYVGGAFTRVTTRTGGGTLLSRDSGALAGAVPVVEGNVHAAVADGDGGWYIGGVFSHVGGVAAGNLARIRADGSVDTAWSPPSVSGTVHALVLAGDRLYAGGAFTAVDGLTRNRLAAFDATTGELDLDWNPGTSNEVRALAALGDTIYAGGGFINAGGEPRSGAAAFDAITGEVDPDWRPTMNGWVYALAAADDTLYMGGAFTTIDGEPHAGRLVAVGTDGSFVPDFNPALDATVWSLTLSGDRLYAGGGFTEAHGEPRANLAAFHAASGALVDDWTPAVSPSLGSDPAVRSLTAAGNTVYAGGFYFLHSIDAQSGDVDASWIPNVDGFTYALAVADDRLFAGGVFPTVGGIARTRLAAFDLATGVLDGDWSPDANSPVTALAVAGDRVYAGGQFTEAGGEARARLAAFDAVSGELDGIWNPGADAQVEALAVSGGRVYAGGAFTEAGGQPRARLAAFETITGLLDSVLTPDVAGDPSPGSGLPPTMVTALRVSGDRVYVGGRFTDFGGTPRTSLAAFSSTNGSVDSDWDPGVAGATVTVWTLAVADDTVYAGGDFSEVGGLPRPALAALNATTGAVDTDWVPGSISGAVYALVAVGERVYAGGNLSNVAGDARAGLAAFARATGTVDDNWQPLSATAVFTLVASDNAIHAGAGSFTGAINVLTDTGGNRRVGLGVLDPETAEFVW